MKLMVLYLTVFFVTNNLCSASLIKTKLINKNATNGRIIGGSPAYPGQYPYMAAITTQVSDGGHSCVGVLLSNEWVLTAAHCVYGAISFKIQVGSITLEGSDPNRLTLSTSTFLVHPDFNGETLENDIGLIKFRLPIQFSDFINSVGQLSLENSTNFEDVRAIGWGIHSDNDTSLSNNLHWVSLSSITNQECSLIYGGQITDNIVCVVGNYNEGPCLGDSGGPLIHQSGSLSILVAISSFLSSNGCENTDPTGYTRIYSYVNWIRQITNTQL